MKDDLIKVEVPSALISRPRSGSHMLMHGLAQHPDVTWDEELLRQFRNGFWSAEQVLTKAYNCDTKVGGFILHDYFRHKQAVQVRKILKECERFRPIMLTRNDYLHKWISGVWAGHVKQWNAWFDLPIRKKEPVYADPYVMLKHFQQYDESIEWDKEYWKSHKQIWVDYDDLRLHWNKALRLIFAWLGVSPTVNMPGTKKLIGNYRKVVTNYDELVHAIAQSKWAYLIEKYQYGSSEVTS